MVERGGGETNKSAREEAQKHQMILRGETECSFGVETQCDERQDHAAHSMGPDVASFVVPGEEAAPNLMRGVFDSVAGVDEMIVLQILWNISKVMVSQWLNGV